MALTPTQRAGVEQWIATHLSNGCPICGSADLKPEPPVVAPLLQVGRQVDYNQVYPLHPVLCTSCGHVLLLVPGALR